MGFVVFAKPNETSLSISEDTDVDTFIPEVVNNASAPPTIFLAEVSCIKLSKVFVLKRAVSSMQLLAVGSGFGA